MVRLYQIILILLLIDSHTLDIVGQITSNYTNIITIDGQTFDIVGKIISNYTEIITIYGQAQNIIGKIISYYTNITTIDGQTQNINGKIISNYTDIIAIKQKILLARLYQYCDIFFDSWSVSINFISVQYIEDLIWVLMLKSL